jgi:MerR family transcriptional regulator, copper efflux regulator
MIAIMYSMNIKCKISFTMSRKRNGGSVLIGELAKQSGVNKTTVRFYTAIGLLPHGVRTAGSRSYTEYSEKIVELVKVIKGSQAAGFTLDEIKSLVADYLAGSIDPARHRRLIEDKLRQIRAKQKELSKLQAYMEQMLAAVDAKSSRSSA